MTVSVVPEATLLAQRKAADPAASVWVSANAGAGKTKVLVDRVVRLLLAGTAPSRILCLTFTKAAAAEMTIRVFGELGSWVTLDDLRLREELRAKTGETPTRAALTAARRLFARAIETPGGLKIETIHAFCERVLHLVPFEAGVPARFTVLDESQSGELLGAARATVLSEAARRPDLAAAVEVVSSLAFGDRLAALVDAAVADPRAPADPDAIALAASALARAFDLRPDETPDAVRTAMLDDGIARADWPGLAAAYRRTGSTNDAKRAAALDAAFSAGRHEARLAAYLAVFFKEDGDPRTDRDLATRGIDAASRERLTAERERLGSLRERLAAAETVERTAALYTLAAAVRAEVTAAKARLGALDFADLIARTVDLLERRHGPWVLYKLDRGIDHVLVDEAQDTNPDQWRILRLLTEEFTAGAGRPARRTRTVFAVGDPKQSIYSFQGAEPREFEEGRRYWLRRAEAARLRFADVRLDLSFRSAPAILAAVDATFSLPAHFKGLSFGDDVRTVHGSARPSAPGAVEIWPTEQPAEGDGDPDAWAIPVDEPDRRAPAVVTAGRVAAAVKRWTTVGDESGRVWRPGEVLILARKRGPAFFAAIRALKSAGIGVAGADRLDVGEHIAVADLVAAGHAALLPANDLALAAALKSPLVGLDDADLVRIAADRGPDETLAAALARAAREGDGQAALGEAALAGWRALARRHGPFGFYATLLGPGEGRRRLIERLGHEAADAVDSFLCYAQSVEFGLEAGTLTGFLARFEGTSHTIKRDLEAGTDEVRVMTVHGAKGLEAPLVVLLDGCDVYGPDPNLIEVPVGGNGAPLPVWALGSRSDCMAVAAARATLKGEALEEHNRLLYVAMTRARDRLVVAPFQAKRGPEPEYAWCAMIRRGFSEATHALVRTAHDFPYGSADVWADSLRAPPGDAARARSAASLAAAPDWLFRPCPPEPDVPPPLRPSGVLDAADRPESREGLSAGGTAEARRRGLLVHDLIEHLAGRAVSERTAAAARFLRVRAPDLPAEAGDALFDNVARVLDDPRLAPLFGPDGRSEVPVVGTVGGVAVSGRMDRLAVLPDTLIVADFKTGQVQTPVPTAYLAQLALYRALLADIHPGRTVRALLVWTDEPAVVEPAAADLDRALAIALAGAA